MQESLLLLDKRSQGLVHQFLPNDKELLRLLDFFDLYADPTRLKILSALSISPMCVTDLARILRLNQTTVSHQLRTLRTGGAVKGTRQGKITFYQVKSKEISDFLLKGLEQFT